MTPPASSAAAPPAAEAPAVVALRGPLTRDTVRDVQGRLASAPDEGPLVIDLGEVGEVDPFGLATLAHALRQARAAGRAVEVQNAPERLRRLGSFVRLDAVLDTPRSPPPDRGALEALGQGLRGLASATLSLLAALQMAYRHAIPALVRSDRIGREQLFRQLDQAGVRAVPIVGLMNFTLGMILAIQLGYVLRYYGALEFIPRFVGVSVTREMGPLMAAILVAGRSGSAMAAEIGAMTVTEEVDALRMMALPARRFLLMPRFLALTLSLPALCAFAILCGILGGAAVGVGVHGIDPASYYRETVNALEPRDVASGLLKSFFFGNLIACIACVQGLRLRGGPEAVGRSATRGVVQAIIAVILFDAVFTALTREVL